MMFSENQSGRRCWTAKIRKTFVYIFMTLGVLATVIGLLLFLSMRTFLAKKTAPILPHSVLCLSLGDYDLKETHGAKEALAEIFNQSGPSLKEILKAIHLASQDPNIKGILLDCEGAEISIAHSQEVRDALHRFRKTGKPVWAFAQTFGDLSNGTKGYYLASAASEIWLQPGGFLGFGGLLIEVPFARELLEKWHVKPQMARREEYKSAFDFLTEKDFTPAHKENMQTLVTTLMKQVIKDVAKDRQLEVGTVETLAHKGAHSDEESVQEKLVDRLGYRDQLCRHIVEFARQPTSKESPSPSDAEQKVSPTASYKDDHFRSIASYLKNKRLPPSQEKMTQFAVIYLEGEIARGQKEGSGLTREQALYDQVIVDALDRASEDKEVKAIILRVNSGGGSSVASESLWRAVQQVVKDGKPVIVSMSEMGASGAYLLATAATKIVAQPGTLTGSIGVIGGKVAFGELWGSLGIHWRNVHFGHNTSMWSNNQEFSPEQWQLVQASVERIYQSFKKRVGEGRKLSEEAVNKVAKGRVWTGEEAKELGLVDALGGIDTAIQLAKEEIHLGSDDKVDLVEYPQKKSFMERIIHAFSGTESIFMMPKFLVRTAKRLATEAELVEESLDRPQLKMAPARVK